MSNGGVGSLTGVETTVDTLTFVEVQIQDFHGNLVDVTHGCTSTTTSDASVELTTPNGGAVASGPLCFRSGVGLTQFDITVPGVNYKLTMFSQGGNGALDTELQLRLDGVAVALGVQPGASERFGLWICL